MVNLYIFIYYKFTNIYSYFKHKAIFYSTAVFGLYQYETYKTLCISQGKSFILLIGSTIGVIIRFLICLLFINSKISLFIFGIVNFVDFYCRSLAYRIILFILNKNNKLNHI